MFCPSLPRLHLGTDEAPSRSPVWSTVLHNDSHRSLSSKRYTPLSLKKRKHQPVNTNLMSNPTSPIPLSLSVLSLSPAEALQGAEPTGRVRLCHPGSGAGDREDQGQHQVAGWEQTPGVGLAGRRSQVKPPEDGISTGLTRYETSLRVILGLDSRSKKWRSSTEESVVYIRSRYPNRASR